MNKHTHTELFVPHTETWQKGRTGESDLSSSSSDWSRTHIQAFIPVNDFSIHGCWTDWGMGLLVTSVWVELIYNRRPWDIFSSRPTSTHIWERITTVSSWNATAVASPISRPRKTAAKKVTTHITCNEQVDDSGYERVRDLGPEPRVGAATFGLSFQIWSRLSTHFWRVVLCFLGFVFFL